MNKTLKILLVISLLLGIVLFALSRYYSQLKSQPVEIDTPTENNASGDNTKKKYVVIDLSKKNLTTLKTEFFNENKNCEDLNVSENDLTGALPAEIRLMSNLKMLNASNNNLTGIPAEIGQLKELEVLDLSNNNIDTMPNEIENLKDNLKILNIKGNKYSQDSIEKLKEQLPSTLILTD